MIRILRGRCLSTPRARCLMKNVGRKLLRVLQTLAQYLPARVISPRTAVNVLRGWLRRLDQPLTRRLPEQRNLADPEVGSWPEKASCECDCQGSLPADSAACPLTH